MVTSRVIDLKGLRMAIYLGYFFWQDDKLLNVMSEMLNGFHFGKVMMPSIQSPLFFYKWLQILIKRKY